MAGHGGRRIGSGRRPTPESGRWLDGGIDHRGRPGAGERPVPRVSVPVEPPDGLTPAELVVWRVHADAAIAAGTLTPATAAEFATLCTLDVQAQKILDEWQVEGITDRGIRLASAWRAMIARLENKRRSFCLAPLGKPLAPVAAEPGDGFGDFDERPRIVKSA